MKSHRPYFYFTKTEEPNYFHLNINNRGIMEPTKCLKERRPFHKTKNYKGELKSLSRHIKKVIGY